MKRRILSLRREACIREIFETEKMKDPRLCKSVEVVVGS
jgi:hypothetical protein